ncbi:Protein fatty acid export 4, chloroplastic [Vitis vinifera]|uniref:Protein fatty acid export 4, chloroplastic n=1 Tax=Vitis vinifera TaxID=29760 RepID=A0A438EGA5_VITVI|nr:Protein fatty acid export 4, chloroplastic [Vitis vinifera]
MLGSWSAEKERLGKKKAKIGVVQFFLRLYMEGTKLSRNIVTGSCWAAIAFMWPYWGYHWADALSMLNYLHENAYLLMQVPKTKDIGDALGFGSAFLFSSVFGIRLAATRKLVPSGLLLGLSIFALTVFISAYLQDISDPLHVS